MRFCFVADESLVEPPHGGIAIWVRRMIEIMTARGHECVVVALTRNGPERTERHAGADHHFLTTPNLPSWLPGRIRVQVRGPIKMSAYALEAARKVRELERAAPFDLVVFSSTNGTGLVGTRTLSSPTAVRWASPHDPARGNPRSWLPQAVKSLFERRSARQADLCFSNSDALRPVFQRLSGATPVLHLRQPLEPVEGAWSASGDEPEEEYLLFFAKGLTLKKGPDVLARALPRVFRAHPGLRLYMIGDDRRVDGTSMRERVRRYAGDTADRIRFFDFMEQAELFPMVAEARAVVIPSRGEHVSFACLEALSLGRPVIGTTGNGMEDVVVPGENGALCAPDDAEGLSAAILETLQIDRRTVEETSRRVLADYDSDAIGRALEDAAGQARRGKGGEPAPPAAAQR